MSAVAKDGVEYEISVYELNNHNIQRYGFNVQEEFTSNDRCLPQGMADYLLYQYDM
jgi:hypothetical protein